MRWGGGGREEGERVVRVGLMRGGGKTILKICCLISYPRATIFCQKSLRWELYVTNSAMIIMWL